MLSGLLTILALISAALTIQAQLRGQQRRVYVFKPLATAAILAIALLALNPPTPFYQWAIVVGLLFSLAGDVFLMLPDTGDSRFLAGLVAFLFAHLNYSAAFANPAGLYLEPIGLLPFALYGLAMLALLWRSLGRMRPAAAVYAAAITFMAAQAFGQWRQLGDGRSLLALNGAILFVFSDTVLALNRFRGRWPAAPLFILGSYYPAQWLIALSAGMAHP